MKVNDYVRTKEFGINKVKWFDNEEPILENGFTALQSSGYKSSPNIIDLIEVGDIVNDEKIIDIGCLTNGPEEGTKVIDYYIAPNTVYYLKNEDIKSIVTKEQFKNMEYEVK